MGRLASLFNASDRGVVVADSVGFPFAYPVVNQVSGAVENRLATFMIQSMIAAVIFAGLVLLLAVNGLRKKPARKGDVCMLFLLAYGAGQIVCDSTRYDSLYLRSNGFISVVQIMGLVAMLVPMIVFAFRMIRAKGFKIWFVGLWLAIAGLLGGAAYMEYYVQRHGGEAAFAYTVMSVCLVLSVLLGYVMYALGGKKRAKAAQ